MTGEVNSTGHYYNGVAVDTMKVTELRSTLAQHGLSTKGVKKELCLRLVEYLETIQEEKEESHNGVENVKPEDDSNLEVNNSDSFQEPEAQTSKDDRKKVNEQEKLDESFIENGSKDNSVVENAKEETVEETESSKDKSESKEVSSQDTSITCTSKDISGTTEVMGSSGLENDSSVGSNVVPATEESVENKIEQSTDDKNGFEEKPKTEDDNDVTEAKEKEGKPEALSIESRITRVNVDKDNTDVSQDKPRAKKRERIVFESDFKGLYSNSGSETLESLTPSKKRLLENDTAEKEGNTIRYGLIIENLQRPWNNGTIKRKLETFGKIIGDSICANEKKTVCLVLFESEDTAIKAQKALDGTTTLPCSSQGLIVRKIDGTEYSSLKENINKENGFISKSNAITSSTKLNISMEQPIKKDNDRSKDIKKSLPKSEDHHHHHHQHKDNDKDNRTHTSSKVSDKNKESLINHRYAKLFPFETKNVIYINNLTRPFCALQLKSMLQVHNTMLEDHFHLMDKKSKCVAVYKNEEAATAISAVLAENKFPQDELGRILNSRIITFEEYLKKLLNSRIEDGPHIDTSSGGDHMISEGKAKRNSPSPRKRSPIQERKSHARREDSFKREPYVAPSLPGMKVTDAKPSLAFAENSYKMPSAHDGWDVYNRNNDRFDDRRRRNDTGFNRSGQSYSRDRR